MLFCNDFSVELSKFKANIERNREKEVEHNMNVIPSIDPMPWIVDFIPFLWGGGVEGGVEGGGMLQAT